MKIVTEREFFDALKADPRDIMPTTERPDCSVWRDQRTRAIFGRSYPGWKNPDDPKQYQID